MSFSNNCKPEKMPGVIKGNPLIGLCDKTVIQVNKVFDACMRQDTYDNITVTLTDITPSTLTPPYRFVSARNTNLEAPIINLVVDEIPGECESRVQGTVQIPIQVNIVDSAGVQGVALATVSIPKDIVLNVPKQSIMPYSITAVASLVSTSGTIRDTELTMAACVTVIIKVTVPVDLLIPTYGYAYIPPCQEYTTEICEGVFDIPLYPES